MTNSDSRDPYVIFIEQASLSILSSIIRNAGERWFEGTEARRLAREAVTIAQELRSEITRQTGGGLLDDPK